MAKHIVLCPVHLWGHARPLAILAARLVKLCPVVVTFVAATKLLPGLQTEALHDFEVDEADAAARLRLLPIEQGLDPLDPTEYQTNFLATWNSVLAGSSVTVRSLDGTEHDWNVHALPPSALVLDLFAVRAFNTLHNGRDSGSPAYKILTWVPIATDSVLTLFYKDMIPEAGAAAARNGTSFDEEAHKLIWTPSGKLLHSPCLPDMYDHEIGPQGLQVPPKLSGRMMIRMARVLHKTDGAITFDAAGYHPEATQAFCEWFSETSRRVYFSGPLVSRVRACGEQDSGVLAFLAKQLASHGEHSVIYISFGSMFWPSDPAKLAAVLYVLMQKGIPFVLARPSPFASMQEEIHAALVDYGNAYIADWVPQQEVLHHAATGWCLTHGGHNTVLECILANVPMILWPIVVDQPINAVHLTENVGVAYELLEVRHGSGLGPIHRTGKTPLGSIDAVQAELRDVLERAFGDDGAEKRARLQALRRTFQEAWADGGSSKRDMEAFVDGV